jgi:hypothetical protein
VQASGTTIGMPFTTFIAPVTGHRSTQEAQKEDRARQKRPLTTATCSMFGRHGEVVDPD